MKILLINDSFDAAGGVETYLTKLKNELKNRRIDVRLLTSDSQGVNNSLVDYYFKHINQETIFRIFPFLFNVHAYVKLKKVLNEFSPDLVHMHYVSYHSSPSILLPLKKIPVVYTTHSHELFSPLTGNVSKNCRHDFDSFCLKCVGFTKYIPEKCKYIFLQFLLNHIDLFIAPSKHHKSLLQKHHLNNSIHLYNGILDKVNNNVNHAKRNLLFVGRLTEEKGAQFTIDALKLVKKKFPSTTLTIVGTGPMLDRLKKQAQDLQLTHAVNFVGHVANNKIDTYYQNATIVLVPSVYPEAFVMVGVEAMAQGKPVIGSNIGGIPEWLKDGKTGFLIEPGNADQIAAKTMFLLSHRKTLRLMGKNAKILAQDFHIMPHTDKLVAHYTQLIKGSDSYVN